MNDKKVEKEEVKFYDWGNFLQRLEQAYKCGEFVLIVGNKGTGKTQLVRKFAEIVGKDITTINFSLRTRESHIVGSVTLQNGNTEFAEGLLVKSMRKGDIFYADEINAAEPDVLIRLDEALDDRRQITLKENGGETIKAKEGWFVIATINPITHAGTKELPPQLLSRFPVRIYLDYPPVEVEEKIVELHTGVSNQDVRAAIELANDLRKRAEAADLYYAPSIRECIAFARMLKTNNGISPRDVARMVFRDVYAIWGMSEYRKIEDLIMSKFER